MTDYKYATSWLDCVSKSPPQEHGGFDPTTITGATAALKEIRRLKRENAMMRWWLRHAECTLDMYHTHIVDEIHVKMPGLFAGGKKGK